ncbi:RNA polymerase I-specific transcription initiation factor RRN3 [Amylocystis lapponica]|nr:RNA polymerase I-specific transcription initiation factor RRN3 [Amylocystis lapponica]
MDPHSRFSQFNSRQTKAGPIASTSRHMEQSKPTNPLESFKKRPTPSRTSSAASASGLYMSRPIATNSRIKQDEQFRKDMYLAFVNNSLQQKANGVSDTFDELVDQFNPRKISSQSLPTSQLRLWILALTHVVSRLERSHYALVDAIIGIPWTTMDTSFVKSYTAFIGMLVSARPEYLSLVLEKLTSGLTYQSCLQALDAGVAESSSTPLTRRIVYERIHYLLQHLISLVPTLSSTLQPMLVRNFPHKRQNQIAQVTYIRNILKITEYCEGLADHVLATVVDRAIQIDVEIQVELEELEENAATQEEAEVFELDPFDTLIGQDGEESGSDENDNEDGDNLSDISSDAGGEADEDGSQGEDLHSNLHHVQSMVDKLDAILKTIFDHFNHIHSSPPVSTLLSSLPSSSLDLKSTTPTLSPSSYSHEEGRIRRQRQFQALLSIFDRTILRTFKSRYTQFLVFWYSSLDPEFSDLFLGTLVTKALLEPDQPAVTRAAGASYIASFVSRAQFVDRDSTRTMVKVLCSFLGNHLDIFDGLHDDAAPPIMANHSLFYAVAQAVFLIFCFRWRDLAEDEEDPDDFALGGVTKKWMAPLGVIQRVITSELNPLKICSVNVVMQFARVAHATDFIYCYSIMEANKRSEYAPSMPMSRSSQSSMRRPTVHPSMLGQSMTAELNTFFPFDPYKLPRSGAYIQGVYREWSSVAIGAEEDEDEDDDGESVGSEEPEENELPQGIAMSGARSPAPDDEAANLGASFGGMSISPSVPRMTSLPAS